jgi:retron-type reverse transcriptase
MTSTYPLSWKLAEVIPLHKGGDPDNAPNNRPVSLLLSLSKICDKVALNQFTDYLMEHKLLTKHQSGNRKLHSTETLNIAVTDILLEAIDKKQLSIIIFLDLSKAFDSVQHDILLKKILDLGVTSEVLNWFKSYLSNRSQYVCIGTATSTCAALEHGIPQGSVLSPFFFNIYTDSLPSSINCSLEAIEEDLQRIFQWCCNHSLLINLEKNKMLIVGSRQMMQQIQTPPNINFIRKILYQ